MTIHGRNLTEAFFIERHNRFVASVMLENRLERVYVPNTGRLAELAIPGEKVLLAPSPGKYRYKILYFYYRGRPVFIDSVAGNDIFEKLLTSGAVQDMEGFRVLRREPPYRNHRFDFLLENPGGGQVFAELKSCTLALDDTASFPDAVSERASLHVEALAETGSGMLIFFILHENVKRFVPNYHRDFRFYQTLKENAGFIDIRVYAARYGRGFEITGAEPVELVIPEVKPAGIFFIIMRNTSPSSVNAGDAVDVTLKAGYYIYAGSAGTDLFGKIAVLKKRKKHLRQPVEHIISSMEVISDIPVVTEQYDIRDACRFLEKTGGSAVKEFTGRERDGSGALYFFEKNPLHERPFWDRLPGLWYGKTGSFS